MNIKRKAYILPHVLVFCSVIISLFYIFLNIVSIENKLTLNIEEGIEQEIIVSETKDEIVNFIKEGLVYKEKINGDHKLIFRNVSQTLDPNLRIANVNIININNGLQTTFIIHYDLSIERIIFWIKTG
ncbi:MAG: hypothetical protein K0S34_380 [Bacillales bacterium]|jgi:hypothetical protein|nr:hypothetical protein [Bacillales bacterium]